MRVISPIALGKKKKMTFIYSYILGVYFICFSKCNIPLEREKTQLHNGIKINLISLFVV